MRKRSRFNLSHINSTTCKMGYIVPVMLTECLPGDTFQGDTKLFTRVAPLNAPVMHRVHQQLFTFFVPNRIIWDDWEAFITNNSKELPEDFAGAPYISLHTEKGSLADYFGLPILGSDKTKTIKISALPFRAYAKIYNDYFRDQDLQEEVPLYTGSGEEISDESTSTSLLRANWAKDYFTTARVSPQAGEGISIPLVGNAPVFLADDISAARQNILTSDGFVSSNRTLYASSSGRFGVSEFQPNGNSTDFENTSAFLDPNGTFFANLNEVSAVTVDELRQAFALQRWQEKRSLYGSRYEDLLHFWGLSTQDYRLQRPELISIRNAPLQFSEVLQTAPVDGDGVGNMAGHGIGAMRSGRWRYYCHEHGFLMTLLVIRPQAVYTQGIERMWTRSTFHDYWNPEFQHIGQQEVYEEELFVYPNIGTIGAFGQSGSVFGYQNRYDEYRRGKNHVTGEFRDILDFWNLARKFSNAPNLNSEFITCSPSDRIFQLSESLSDQFYIMVQNDLIAKRLMSRNGNPI